MYKLKHSIVITASVLLYISSTYATLESRLTNSYPSARSHTSLESIYDTQSIGGIYDAQLDRLYDAQTVSMFESIDLIHRSISSSSSCDNSQRIPQKSDITNLLMTDGSFILMIDQLPDAPTDRPSSKQIQNSCERINPCIGISEPRGQTKLCKAEIARLYHYHHNQRLLNHGLTDSLYGTQFFHNGTLDDSSYDLMLDIELIGNIMFGSNQPVIENIYYRMPTLGAANASLNENNNDNDTTPIVDNNLDPFIPRDTPNDTIIQGPGNTTPGNTTPGINATTTTPSNVATATGAPLFANICIAEDNIITDTTNTTSDNTSTLTDDQIAAIRGEYQNYRDDLINNYDIPFDDPFSPLNNIFDNEGGNNSTIDAVDNGLPDHTEIRACISDCSANYDGQDKLVCIAQCACGQAPESFDDPSNQYLKYYIRYCRIPTSVEAPFNNDTTVYSIEETIDAINTTLAALEASGAMHKRNEKQETLDTSLKNMNIGDGFIFSVNIATKPATNKGSSDNQNQQVAILGYETTQHQSLLTSTDPNKYTLNSNYMSSAVNTAHAYNNSLLITNQLGAISSRNQIIYNWLTDMDAYVVQMQNILRTIQQFSRSMEFTATNSP